MSTALMLHTLVVRNAKCTSSLLFFLTDENTKIGLANKSCYTLATIIHPKPPQINFQLITSSQFMCLDMASFKNYILDDASSSE